MPFDPNAWKRAALAHYIALAQLPTPRAKEEAIALAAAAEAASGGALKGLAEAVKAQTDSTPGPAPAKPPRRP